MVIAINTIGLLKNNANEDIIFFEELVIFIAKTKPNNSFIFIVNQPIPKEILLPKNCTTQLITATLTNLLQLVFFYTFTLKLIIKKSKANVLLHLHPFCSPAINIPQIIVVKNVDVTVSLFTKYYFKKSLKKAARIVVNDDACVAAILSKYSTQNPPKIQSKFEIITGAANASFKILDYLAKVFVKDGYADGCDYFIAVAYNFSFKEFITLLKAFSVFKRWQKSNMKLLIVGNISDYKQQLQAKFNTYKYRDDLVAISSISQQEKAKLLGAAYAVILPSIHTDFFLSIIQSLQVSVPVMVNNTRALQEQFADALLYVDMQNHEVIASQMKLLYRDENLRTNFISKGTIISQGFSFTKSATTLWQCMLASQ